jgi:pilus assembly protein Flp/PilA
MIARFVQVSVFRAFARDERGTTMIEYAVLCMIITVGIILAITAIGGSLTGIFADAAAGLT